MDAGRVVGPRPQGWTRPCRRHARSHDPAGLPQETPPSGTTRERSTRSRQERGGHGHAGRQGGGPHQAPRRGQGTDTSHRTCVAATRKGAGRTRRTRRRSGVRGEGASMRRVRSAPPQPSLRRRRCGRGRRGVVASRQLGFPTESPEEGDARVGRRSSARVTGIRTMWKAVYDR